MTEKEAGKREKLSLAPLDFEEALRGLLETPPPPKGEDESERELPKRPRKRKQADETRRSQ